jgi:hypothetical protein
MTISIVLEIQRAQLLPRVHNRIMRQLHRENMERHVANRLPKHFKMIAYSEYGARRRSAKWEKTKARRYHTKNLPNVASGKLKESIRTKITATPDGARLQIRAALGEKLPADEWAAMSPAQKAQWTRQNTRRMAAWQKQEIAVMSKAEIAEERKRLAIDYRIAALNPANSRKRKRRTR